MIEGILAWVMLFGGIVSDEPLAFIASAAFSVAAQINRIVNRMDGER